MLIIKEKFKIFLLTNSFGCWFNSVSLISFTLKCNFFLLLLTVIISKGIERRRELTFSDLFLISFDNVSLISKLNYFFLVSAVSCFYDDSL